MVIKKLVVVLESGKCPTLYAPLLVLAHKISPQTFAFSKTESFEAFIEETKGQKGLKKFLIVEPLNNDSESLIEAKIVLPC